MRVVFVSHSFPPLGRPMANVGGMQRVATGLSSFLERRTDLTFSQLVLRSSWRSLHIKCVPWLPWIASRLHFMARQQAMDVVLFSSMVTGALAILLKPVFEASGIRVAAIVHGRDVTLPGLYQRLLIRPALAALDCVMPVSRATGRACVDRECRWTACRLCRTE